ncbi:Mediator of RNA polymerase II transcription subunit 7 [Mycena venus]|uniref:Mediator of RNA polymerase II transcription subunit 7 n=1 Tax=Mycena venus TaxID=2733690 RepID=A0A8H6XT51_9AGAR|nr:Mediator of RNA polymerase II transcription subunit 7 [Mycena venus]
MDEEDGELRNPFPSPPSHYTKYTTHNLALLALYNQRLPDHPNPIQHQILSDQTDVPEWPLTQLEKPRIDWILEEPDAYYDVFGERWFVKDKIPSLAELGGNQLYPEDPCVGAYSLRLPRSSASLSFPQTAVLHSLLAPPPTMSATGPPEWQGHVEWITVLGQNLMAAANDLRPVQARGNLELMMQRQLDLRREETKSLHAKCDVLEAKLKELRASAQLVSNFSSRENPTAADTVMTAASPIPSLDSFTNVQQEDVRKWAEEVG